MNVVLLGPPGSGKSTQGRLLAQHFGLPHVVTGDLLRGAVAEGTPVGRLAESYLRQGALVPDDVVFDLVRARLDAPDTAPGFVLDGFPRTVAQARQLGTFLAARGRHLTLAVLLAVPDEVAIERIAGRLTCPTCGAVFARPRRRKQAASSCPACGHRLGTGEAANLPYDRRQGLAGVRWDDRPAVARRRLHLYRREIAPVLDYYRHRQLLREVDGVGSEAEVFRRLLRAIAAATYRPLAPPLLLLARSR